MIQSKFNIYEKPNQRKYPRLILIHRKKKKWKDIDLKKEKQKVNTVLELWCDKTNTRVHMSPKQEVEIKKDIIYTHENLVNSPDANKWKKMIMSISLHTKLGIKSYNMVTRC